MQAIKIRANQTNIDIAMMAFGSAELVFDLPNVQQASITEEIIAGDTIENIEDAELDKKSIVAVLNRVMFLPASKKQKTIAIPQNEGVDYWAVGTDFIIN